MNISTTTKGEQAKNQLIAAALAQFGEYGLHATTRDIAAQAGQNIAAITYYFGSKEDLYLACAQWIADFIGGSFAHTPKKRKNCLPSRSQTATQSAN